MKNSIAILIPHYNNPIGLKKSIQSVSDNSDIYIIDDGSKILFNEDELMNLKNCCVDLNFIYLSDNKGIEEALNTGLVEIRKKGYKYVARLDCGDININDRISKQVSFLDRNKDIFLVGSWVDFVDEKGKFLYRVKPPINHKTLKKKYFINCMFIHPTVMFRVSAIDLIGYYPTTFHAAEDYAYFFKFIKNFHTANIPEVLVKVEANPNGISSRKRKQQVISRIKIILNNFYPGFYPIYGLLRNILLYIMPLKIINAIKKLLINGKN